MRRLWNRLRYSELFCVFNFRDAEAKGRCCLIFNVLLTNEGMKSRLSPESDYYARKKARL